MRLLVLIPLLLFCFDAYAQSNQCLKSELGYDCKSQATDFMAVHWSLGPISGDIKAAEGEIAIALVGQTMGWVGIGFPDKFGSMAPADIALGWVDSGETILTSYHPTGQSISKDDVDDSVKLSNIKGKQANGVTTIQFVRRLDEGKNPIKLQPDFPVNVAIGDSDALVYHGTTRDSLKIDFGASLGESAAPTSSPAEEASPPSELSIEPSTEPESQRMKNKGSGPAELENKCGPLSGSNFTCTIVAGDVTIKWAFVPDESTSTPFESGEVRMAISAATEGWVGVSFAEIAGSMDPANVLLGWISGNTVTANVYEINSPSISENEISENFSLRDLAGSQVDGITTVSFVFDTKDVTFPVDFTQNVDMNWAVGANDALAYHGSRRGSFAMSFLSGNSIAISQDLGDYKVHGSFMIVAWIGLAPLGVLIARNKDSFRFKVFGKEIWFIFHACIQALALLCMIIGLIIASIEFDDPASEEGKRHRRVGIAIIVIGLVQGVIPIFRPHPDSPFRYIFNYIHWYLGRGAVVLGISTVFLGIKAFDLINDDNVDNWWITCVAILAVYFVIAAIGEIFVTKRRTEESIRKMAVQVATTDDVA